MQPPSIIFGMGIFDGLRQAWDNAVRDSEQQSRIERDADAQAFTIAGASYRQAAFRQFAKESGCDRSGKRVMVNVILMPDTKNPKDPDAIAVFTPKMKHIGYVPADLTKGIHAKIPPLNRRQTWKITAPAELYWWKNLYLVNIWS